MKTHQKLGVEWCGLLSRLILEESEKGFQVTAAQGGGIHDTKQERNRRKKRLCISLAQVIKNQGK